jgi:hypothetical protein
MKSSRTKLTYVIDVQVISVCFKFRLVAIHKTLLKLDLPKLLLLRSKSLSESNHNLNIYCISPRRVDFHNNFLFM